MDMTMTCYTPSAILGANDTQTNKKNKSLIDFPFWEREEINKEGKIL